MTPVTVLSVASEIFPLIKTGGLADVVGALPQALVAEDVTVSTLIPGYPAVLKALKDAATVRDFADLFGGPARLLRGRAPQLDLFVIDAPHLYDRSGNPYVTAAGDDWPDNAFRFAALARIAAEIGQGLLADYTPDIVHAHDWQAALVAAYLHYSGRPRPKIVVTVHNLAFQGLFARELLSTLALPEHSFSVEGVEFYGKIGFLKAGLQLADIVTTVSPTYATEIQTASAGMGLEGLLIKRSRSLVGILNGIDTDIWNPTTDRLIGTTYSARRIAAARGKNKVALQERFGLSRDATGPLLAVISRLTWQKGFDLLLSNVDVLLEEGAQLAILGTGEARLEAEFVASAAANPGRIGCVIGFDESLAHLLQAGGDALLIPSRFEPCGLTQLCALRYGCVPIVARVGGLADTIVDANEMALTAGVATGLQFFPVEPLSLANAIRRAVRLYFDRPKWKAMQTNGMATDVSWRQPAARYAALYRALIIP
jgi:starch synthase